MKKEEEQILGTFAQVANTFELKVTLLSKNLKIQLKDLVDWKVYERIYSEDDIGKDIHKKVYIEDIYYAFASSNSQADQTKTQQIQKGITLMRDYKFGQIIKSGQIPCYKIQKGGKITAYSNSLDKRTNREINHQSILSLTKSKDMSQVEIFCDKSIRDKNQYAKMFSYQIQTLRKQNGCLRDNMEQVKATFKRKLSQCQHNLAIQIRKRQELSQFLQKNKLLIENGSKLESVFKSLVVTHGLPCPCNGNFLVSTNNVITYVNPNAAWSHFFFNEKIPKQSNYGFSIKIIKTQARNITIGVGDYQKQKKNNNSQGSNNYFHYNGANGNKNPGGAQQGVGFNQGQIIEVKVNLKQKAIRWFVAGNQRASLIHEFLGDQDRTFYPCVELHAPNDAIEWISS